MNGHRVWVSSLPKTCFIDLDGVVLRHNGHLSGDEELLSGAAELWGHPGPDVHVILLPARPEG